MSEVIIPNKKVLILGSGWVGSRLSATLSDCVVTHRALKDGHPPNAIQFELNARETWSNLPSPYKLLVVITFSITSDPAVLSDFYDEYLSKVDRVVVYSTTSVFGNDIPDADVDETFPLTGVGRSGEIPQPRVVSEEFLRERGAVILTLSGLFGYDREPVNWIRKGWIKNGAKLVNLIHVDDVVRVTRGALGLPLTADPSAHQCDQHGERKGDEIQAESPTLPSIAFGTGLRLIVSGGCYRWSELAAHYAEQERALAMASNGTSEDVSGATILSFTFPLPEEDLDGRSRRLSNAALCGLLPPSYRFTLATDAS